MKNIVIFVHTTTAKSSLLFNRRNRKVAGGSHNVLVHHLDISVLDLEDVVCWNPFKEDILCSFLVKNHVVCVPAMTAECILLHNHMSRKVVGGKHNVLVHYVDVSAPDPEDVLLCNPSK